VQNIKKRKIVDGWLAIATSPTYRLIRSPSSFVVAVTFAPAAAKETVQVEGEEGTSGTDQASPSLGSRAATTTMTANYTSEDPAASRGETGSSTAGTGAATETTTGLTEKTRKK
jgi:hypothetical protein